MAIGINPCFNLCAPKLPACRFERGRGKVSGRVEKCQRCLLDGWDGKNRAGVGVVGDTLSLKLWGTSKRGGVVLLRARYGG